MSFFANNNRIFVTDTADNMIFDTDSKMPSITSVASGSLYITSRSPGNDGFKVYNIQNVSYNPTFVLTMGYIVGDSDYPWSDTYFNASGTIITNLGWQSSWEIGVMRTLSFYVKDNVLCLEENWFSHFSSISTKGFTIDFTCYLGSF
jgi:hypothetical protein